MENSKFYERAKAACVEDVKTCGERWNLVAKLCAAVEYATVKKCARIARGQIGARPREIADEIEARFRKDWKE